MQTAGYIRLILKQTIQPEGYDVSRIFKNEINLGANFKE